MPEDFVSDLDTKVIQENEEAFEKVVGSINIGDFFQNAAESDFDFIEIAKSFDGDLLSQSFEDEFINNYERKLARQFLEVSFYRHLRFSLHAARWNKN
ncbi:hypothetical protein HUG10_05780 [Halorarum halophilum]|uniref:Uncharacterized protein n=1 Tax=Halorarum halophilum TaxID=2743090 RepID=A0A7D5L2N8_9EURY|nr:hypothetical protein [Halobaculum halophilum]QLG27083.1 hypothetical protein HUG10_05780 [Halobaculum halophilum]